MVLFVVVAFVLLVIGGDGVVALPGGAAGIPPDTLLGGGSGPPVTFPNLHGHSGAFTGGGGSMTVTLPGVSVMLRSGGATNTVPLSICVTFELGGSGTTVTFPPGSMVVMLPAPGALGVLTV